MNIKGKLTVKQVESLTEAGRYNDGNGLYLFIKKAGGKSWVLRTRIRGKQTDLGLGGVSFVNLHEAREKAYALRKIARSGGDPRIEKNKVMPNFEELAIKTHNELKKTWKNGKHVNQWISTLEQYAFPYFGKRPINEIDRADVLKAIQPIWAEKNETASRVLQRIGTVFDQAKALRHFSGENPAHEIRALKVLPKVKRKVKPHAALPWRELPELYQRLCEKDTISSYGLRFTILCATRTSETTLANWDEIHDDTWIIPDERMKRDIEHRIPLSDEALNVLEIVRGRSENLIFEGSRRNRPMSENTMLKLGKTLTELPVTTHGFRSTFRDWAAEIARARFEAAEEALSHAYKTSTQAAYLRSDLFQERRELMQRWADFVTGRNQGQVVRFG